MSIENSSLDQSSLLSPWCTCPSTDRNRNQVPLLPQFLASSRINDEKKVSTTSAYDDKLTLVDPLESSVRGSNQSPEFLIRDYVNGLRIKDVQQHWPFSDENLMLCLKHGVRNLLPPFQPLDSPKNPSVIEKSLPENGSVTSLNVEPSRQSENKSPSQPNQLKKCKLGLKLNPVVDPTIANEDITPKNLLVSESMASHVCPVCKTFTSSSNTTLNAHIDQCLSGESKSTMKRTANVIKNRVKPRKTKLMTDIYKTALHCTVEELDRRNGTNWSTNSSFPTQEIEFHGEEREKEQKASEKNAVETGHEGDWTKNRISSAPEIGAEDDHGSRKLLKRKYNKFVADKYEKKTREQKPRKLLRLRKKFSSPKPPRDFEMGINQEENISGEKDSQEDDTPKGRFQSDEELEVDGDSGTKEKISRTLSSSETPISSPESSKKMDTSSYEPQDDEYVNHLPLRKRLGFRPGFSASKKAVERKFSALEETLHLGPSQADHLHKQSKDSSGHVESSGKENQTHEEDPTIGLNSKTSAVGRIRNNMIPELDSQNSIWDYQGPFSEPEKLTLSPQPIVDDREKEFCEDNIGKTMTEKTNCKIGELDYCLEVEPITIPGPPGSFLPSPGADMVVDVQGNSSLTNSRVQSSEDRLDLADRDPMTLDSPISASSAVSNPTLTRSNSRSYEKLSVRSVANMVGERIETTLPEKGVSPSLRNDHQPSGFSRKEDVAQRFSSLCQESDILRSRAIDCDKCPVNSLTLNPKTFTLSNFPPEKEFVHPEHVHMTAPTATVAASPVLRLMGKDLMVDVKKAGVAPAPQLTPPQSSSSYHTNQHLFTAPLPTAPSIHQNYDYYQPLQGFPPYGHGGSHPFLTPQVHFPSGYDSRRVNSFYHNQLQGSFSYGGPHVVNHASFPMPVSREMINASPAVWNHVPEGSSNLVGVSRGMNTTGPGMWNHVPESSTIGVSSPSRAHWRSTTYIPTRFS